MQISRLLKNVASEGSLRHAGAQEPEHMREYVRITDAIPGIRPAGPPAAFHFRFRRKCPSTAGTQNAKRSSFPTAC